jgi:hypothetical protein
MAVLHCLGNTTRPDVELKTLLLWLPLVLQVEDRPIVRERVETNVEHRPTEKEFKTEVRSASRD